MVELASKILQRRTCMHSIEFLFFFFCKPYLWIAWQQRSRWCTSEMIAEMNWLKEQIENKKKEGTQLPSLGSSNPALFCLLNREVSNVRYRSYKGIDSSNLLTFRGCISIVLDFLFALSINSNASEHRKKKNKYLPKCHFSGWDHMPKFNNLPLSYIKLMMLATFDVSRTSRCVARSRCGATFRYQTPFISMNLRIS